MYKLYNVPSCRYLIQVVEILRTKSHSATNYTIHIMTCHMRYLTSLETRLTLYIRTYSKYIPNPIVSTTIVTIYVKMLKIFVIK